MLNAILDTATSVRVHQQICWIYADGFHENA